MSAMQFPQLTLLRPSLNLGNNLHIAVISRGRCKHCLKGRVQMENIFLAMDHVVGALQGWDGVSHTLYRVIHDRPLGTGQGAPTQCVGYSLALARRSSERESIIEGIHSNLEEMVGEVLQGPRE